MRENVSSARVSSAVEPERRPRRQVRLTEESEEAEDEGTFDHFAQYAKHITLVANLLEKIEVDGLTSERGMEHGDV